MIMHALFFSLLLLLSAIISNEMWSFFLCVDCHGPGGPRNDVGDGPRNDVGYGSRNDVSVILSCASSVRISCNYVKIKFKFYIK